MATAYQEARVSKRLRKQRVPEDARIARLLELPMHRPGEFEAIDISNHTDGDQRKMVRSGERRTIRRKPKLSELVVRKVLSPREAAACEWYAKMHSLRYDTTGITANLGGVSGRSNVNFDHLPKTREQWQAYQDFEHARAGINPMILPMFERVVLHGHKLGKLAITFRSAARQLLARIEGIAQL